MEKKIEEIQSGIQAINIQKCPEVEHIHDCIETRPILNGCDSLDVDVMQNGIEKMKISSFGAQDEVQELNNGIKLMHISKPCDAIKFQENQKSVDTMHISNQIFSQELQKIQDGIQGVQISNQSFSQELQKIQDGIQGVQISNQSFSQELQEIQDGIQGVQISKLCDSSKIQKGIQEKQPSKFSESSNIQEIEKGIKNELGEGTSPVSDDKQIIFSKTDELLLECGSDILGSSVENGLKNEKNHENSNIVNLNSSPQTKSSQSLKLDGVLNWEHQLKWIQWNKKRTPIVTQNSNGPCPLIAIANVLLLCRKIILPSVMEFITANQLLEFVADSIFENIPKDLSGVTQLNYEQNVYDAIAILPHLHTGLDVNVKFTGVQDFEYTPECIIFDLLNIPLYHGWLVDPQAQDTVKSLGNLGYNQLVENIVINKDSADSELFSRAVIAEEFLEKTASQLTYHGLCELNSALRNDELAVFFRNNHFSTIVKKKVSNPSKKAVCEPLVVSQELNELFQLVTDQGFLLEPRVVWESLSNIENDGYFVDGHFLPVPQNALETSSVITHQQLIGHDNDLASQLQDREQRQSFKSENDSVPSMQDLAQSNTTTPAVRNKKGSCTLF